MANKKRKLNKKAKWLIGLITLVLLVTYFATSLSRITTIEVITDGNLSPFEIKTMAQVKENDIQLLKFDFFVKKHLEKHPLIERAHVENIFFGKMKITVYEKKVYGYMEMDDKVMFITDNAKTFQLEDEALRNKIKGSVPRITLPLKEDGTLNTTILVDLVAKLKIINADSFAQISEIEYRNDVSGNDFIITMAHPKQIRFFTKLEYLKNAMKYYYELSDQVSGTNVCIYMFSETKAIPEKCK